MNPIFLFNFWGDNEAATVQIVVLGGYVNIRILGSDKCRDFLPVGESFIVELEGAKDATGAYDNDLSLTATIEPAAGGDALISAQSMTYVTASNGTYRATMPNSLAMEAGSTYRVVVAGDADRDEVRMAN